MDFGLAVKHINPDTGLPNAKDLTNNRFKGTISYASLNAHHFEDLSRRDDMWSFFFIVLEYFGVKLPWRHSDDNLSFEQV